MQPRCIRFFAEVLVYWEKDDHDFRYDDSDPFGNRPPPSQLGIATFLEQVPVADPKESNPLTYRSYRRGRHLQVWLPEGRDYRNANDMPDGPGKTIWGQVRMAQRTLLQSDATFKILVSPTPIVGPDRDSKRDNHTDMRGFRHEGSDPASCLE